MAAYAPPQRMQARQVQGQRAPLVPRQVTVPGGGLGAEQLRINAANAAIAPPVPRQVTVPSGPPNVGRVLGGIASVLAPVPVGVVQAVGALNRIANQGPQVQAEIEQARQAGGLRGAAAEIAGPLVQRLSEIGPAINAPVSREEAQASTAISGVPVKLPESFQSTFQVEPEGSAPTVGRKLVRAAGEAIGAGLTALGEPFMQTTGRLAGAATRLARRFPGSGLPDFSRLPGSLEAYGVDNFGKPASTYDPNAPKPTWKDAWAALVEGRTAFTQDVHPINQMLLGLVADPMILYSELAGANRFKNLAGETFRFNQLAATTTAEETARLVKTGELFETSAVKGALAKALPRVFARTPESIGALTAETAMSTLSQYVRLGNTASEKLELMQMFAKAARGDESWRVTADAYGLLRTTNAEDVARLKGLGVPVGAVVSPVESQAGQITGLVLDKVIGSGGAKRQTLALLDTIDQGYKPGVTREAITAADSAAQQLLGRLVKASEELAGASGKPGAVERYWNAYQGAYARVQLASPGRVTRDALASVTDGIADGVLGNFEKGFWQDKWRGYITGGHRGVSAESVGRVAGAGGEGNLLRNIVNLPARAKQAQEDFFAQMAVKRGVDWVFGKVWRGEKILPAEMVAGLRAAVGDEVTNRFLGGLTSAWDVTDIDRVVKNLLGNEAWRNLTPEWAAKFRAYGVDGKVIETLGAASADDFSRAAKDLEVKLRRDVRNAPATTATQDVFEQAWRAELERQGFNQADIDKAAGVDLPLREASRERKRLAQAMARDAVDSIPDEAARATQQEAWLQLKQRIDSDQAKAAGEMVAQLKAARLRGTDEFLAQMEANSAEWSRLFQKEVDDWHTFREAVEAQHVPADLRLPPDVARELTGVPESATGVNAETGAPVGAAAVKPVEPPPDIPRNTDPIPVDPAQAKRAQLPHLVRDLRAWRDETMLAWGGKFDNLTPEAAQQIQEAAKIARARLAETRNVAERFGTTLRDGTYFNYSDRRNFDALFRTVYAYPYWYTRETAAWARRIFTNPHMVWALQQAHQQVTALNQDAPEWMRSNLVADVAGGGLLSFPIFANLDPTYQAWKPDYHDPVLMGDQAGRLYTTLNDFGPGSTHAAIPQILGTLAAMAGKDDLAYAYASRISALTSVIQAATGLPAEQLLRFIPPYNYMFVKTDRGDLFVGTKYDRKQIAQQVANMVAQGEITQEESERVANIVSDPYNSTYRNNPDYAIAWSEFRTAVDRWRQAQLFTTASQGVPIPSPLLSSYVLGPGVRYRGETQTAILNSQQAYAALKDQRANLTPEQYSQKLAEFFNDPANQAYSIYRLWNKAGSSADEDYAWSVLSRLPPGRVNDAYLEAAGMDPELLSQFYSAKGVPDLWIQRGSADLATFMQAVSNLGASLAAPDLATRSEWDQVKGDFKELRATLAGEFTPDMLDLYETYKYGGLTNDQQDTLKGKYPEIGQIAAREMDIVLSNPLLAAYYATAQTIEANERDRFYTANAESKFVYDQYQALQRQGEFDEVAATLAKQYKRENQATIDAYLKARDAFYATLDERVAAFGDSLPDVTLPAFRADLPVTAGSTFSKSLEDVQQQKQIEALAGPPTKGGTGGPPSDAEAAASALVESQRAEIIAQMERSYTHLNADNLSAYENDYLNPIVDYFGAAGGLQYMDTPFVDAATGQPAAWTPAQAGVPGLLAFVGESKSIRDALVKYAASRGDANWARYVALLRGMDEAQLAQLTALSPKLGDARLVAQQAQAYDYPSVSALNDILGINVNIGEDGEVKISKQNIDRNKRRGGGFTYGPYLGPTAGEQGGPFVAGSNGAGGTAGGNGNGAGGYTGRPHRVYAPRGGGGRAGAVGAPEAPVPDADPLAEWQTFSGQLRLEKPDLLVLLMDWFDSPGGYGEELLRDHPELVQFLQTILDRLPMLAQGYAAWREQVGPSQVLETLAQSQRARARPNILRVYAQRPSRTGLPT